MNGEISERFLSLSTPLVADAMVRLRLPVAIAPSGIRPLVEGSRFVGPASPVVLDGHADRVLEGIYRSRSGDVLLLDNKGRTEEACFGDLAAYEARSQSLSGVAIWGRHRDSADLFEIGVPLFSYGSYPLGMQRTHAGVADPFARCQFGVVSVERNDLVFADRDGVLFVPEQHIERVIGTAEEIAIMERAQVEKIRAGTRLREQLDFDGYLKEKERNPTLTLGEHMKKMGRHF